MYLSDSAYALMLSQSALLAPFEFRWVPSIMLGVGVSAVQLWSLENRMPLDVVELCCVSYNSKDFRGRSTKYFSLFFKFLPSE